MIAVALHSADPQFEGTELPAVGGYARVLLKVSDFDYIDKYEIANCKPIIFNEPTEDWNPVTHFGLWDTDKHNSGKLIGFGPLTQRPEAIKAGDDAPSFGIGTLTAPFGLLNAIMAKGPISERIGSQDGTAEPARPASMAPQAPPSGSSCQSGKKARGACSPDILRIWVLKLGAAAATLWRWRES